jgi:ADP-ribose pyrophosphatase YjhB (NUDIX family)
LAYRYCPHCTRPLDTITEDHASRLHCSACRWTHYPATNLAACVVIEHQGGLLLLKRAILPDIGIWHFPIGHVEFGESPEQAALREATEETGLLLAEPVFLDYHWGPGYGDPRDRYIVFCYRARAVGGELTLDAENSEALVADPLAMPHLKWTSNQRALAAWQAWEAGHPWQAGRPFSEIRPPKPS